MGKRIKMVAGKTYVSPSFLDGRLIARGETVSVDDETAEHMLTLSYFDALNNEHFYFKEVGSDAVSTDADESATAGASSEDEDDSAAPARKQATKRTRSAAK